jgi:hypothetical protein
VLLTVHGDLQERAVSFNADVDRESGRRSFAERK